MNRYDVVVIGAGLGGLECGYMLSKIGLSVLVLEKERRVGGCLQCFRRGGHEYDTGFHYVGGLSDGQPLHNIFNYYRLLDLPWHQLDESCYDEVVVGNQSFPHAQGYERFVERLCEQFPKSRKELNAYVSLLREVGESLPKTILSAGQELSSSYFAHSAYAFVNETISDPLLRKVLCGSALKMELKSDTLPLYTFAQINSSFVQSAWRLKGGGQQLCDRLAEGIRAMGGEVRTQAEVTELIEEEGAITTVVVGGNEHITAKRVIADLHPAMALALVKQSTVLRKIYRNRIARLENTYGMFTANLRLKPQAVPYANKNIFVHAPESDPWNVQTNSAQVVMVSYQVPQGGDYADNIDLLTPMDFGAVEAWGETSVGRRGVEYDALKEQLTEKCLQRVCESVPSLRGNIEAVYSSSPLTYRDYVHAPSGTAYGVRKDYNNPLMTILAPQTPIHNLLLTGQSLNLHGVLGTSMTSLFTSAAVVGLDKIIDEFNVRQW